MRRGNLLEQTRRCYGRQRYLVSVDSQRSFTLAGCPGLVAVLADEMVVVIVVNAPQTQRGPHDPGDDLHVRPAAGPAQAILPRLSQRSGGLLRRAGGRPRRSRGLGIRGFPGAVGAPVAVGHAGQESAQPF